MKDNPRWEELCKQASVEQDPKTLMELVKEINRLLGEKHDRLVRSLRKHRSRHAS